MLLLDFYHLLSLIICFILLITYHLLYYHLTCDYHISRILSCYPILYTVTCISNTYVLLLLLQLLNLSCSCYSLNDNYIIINYEKANLHRVRKNWWTLSGEYVYNGIKYIVQLKLSVPPEGLQVLKGSAGFLPPVIFLNGYTIRPHHEHLAASFVHQKWNT